MEKIKVFFDKELRQCILINFAIAFVLNLVIEIMARQQIVKGFQFMLESPLVFLCNVLIIFATLSTCLLVKRRLFVRVIWIGLWMALGITNGVILSNRMTPFTTKDLSILEDGLSIVTNYLSTKEIVLVAVGLLLLVTAFIVLFVKGRKIASKLVWKKQIPAFILCVLVAIGAVTSAVKVGMLETFFGNLAYGYRDNGVPYCFLNTWLNTGVRKPMAYSKTAVFDIFDEDELAEDGNSVYGAIPGTVKQNRKLPNIIFIQLESFIDPMEVKTIEVSEDPIPNYRRLMEKYSSGYLTVPSVGAGTANTEFETICGMSVKFFGPGEYPYKAILREKPCESAAWDLKNLGYKAHAIHNHRGVFYGRNEVFANLGFDTFTSLEYMNHVVKTPKNWAKDTVLTEQILAALESTEEKDYIYTISVQGHGKYPTEQLISKPAIQVTKAPTEELKWQYEYYVNQIYEMDIWIGELIKALSKYKEEVVLVMYGDHLPALEMAVEDMESGDLYKTEYVVWSNFKLQRIEKDLYAYQLTAEVLDRLRINLGTMTLFHQNHSQDEDYLKSMQMLEYDMLYGKEYIYGGENPYEKTNLQMGIKPIVIEEVVTIGDKYFIKGQNFTPYSKISLDGEILKTIYLSSSVLGLQEDVSPQDAVRMKVSQVEKNKEILSTTE